ncbi:MAG: hypothetical protein ACLS43_04385 [Evtepia gabavorous]
MWSACSPPERGDATICLHGVLILLQLLILRRRYDPVQLLRLPVALVFGYLTDLGVWVIQGIPVPSMGCGGCCAWQGCSWWASGWPWKWWPGW